MAVIQLRSGAYADYDPAKMHAAEAAVILSGDPETADGKSIRIAFGAGDDKRLLTEDDAFDVDAELDALSENPVQNKVVKAALDAKAPSASPIFTGIPQAPTAAAGTSNTQLATTAFVQQEIGAIPLPVKKIWTGVCSTAKTSAAKVVTLDDASDFALADGVSICVYFTNGSTANNPVLNVNGTGNKPIYYTTSDIAGSMIGTKIPHKYFGVGCHVFTYSSNRWYRDFGDMAIADYFANLTSTLTATDQGSGVVSLSLT